MFFEKTSLANGLEILSEFMPGVRSVTLGVWVRVGSRDELPSQSGLSHFMEHMMFKGTPTRSALDISLAFDRMGAELNAFTAKEYTCYYARFQDEHLETAVQVLADMLQNSEFADEAARTEREVVIEEIARYEDEPSDHVGDIFTEAMYPTHQLGRPILGTRAIVTGFGQQECAAYLSQHYHAANTVVTAAGNIEHSKLVQLVESCFSGMPAGSANSRGEVLEAERQLLAYEQKDTEQAHLIYGMPGIALGSEDRFAGSLLETALGGPMSSRLFQSIREQRGLAYAVYASTQPFMHAAQFSIYVGTRPANLKEVIAILRSELNQVVRAGLSAAELADMQEFLVGYLVLSEESTRSHMMRLGSNAVLDLEILSLDENIERIRAVSLEDVQRVAQMVLTAEPTIAVISPLGKSELQELLEG